MLCICINDLNWPHASFSALCSLKESFPVGAHWTAHKLLPIYLWWQMLFVLFLFFNLHFGEAIDNSLWNSFAISSFLPVFFFFFFLNKPADGFLFFGQWPAVFCISGCWCESVVTGRIGFCQTANKILKGEFTHQSVYRYCGAQLHIWKKGFIKCFVAAEGAVKRSASAVTTVGSASWVWRFQESSSLLDDRGCICHSWQTPESPTHVYRVHLHSLTVKLLDRAMAMLTLVALAAAILALPDWLPKKYVC